MKKKNVLLLSVVFIFSLISVQCSKDNEIPETQKEGQLKVKITDAPADDSNIKGTFVTVADVKIDGKPVSGFTKQTIEISAYQNGKTSLLLDKMIEAKSYNSVTLVLDYGTDASGNSPGCYVLTADDHKHNLSSTSEVTGEIMITKQFEVNEDTENSVVIDFDLRKTIVRNTDNSSASKYKFSSTAELTSSIRLVKEEDSGEITGKVNMMFVTDDDTYVFLYKKGQYNNEVESTGQGESNIQFANAVTSARVKTDGSYTLSFLEKGDYELHLASFGKQQDTTRTTFTGMLNASSAVEGVLLNSIELSAKAQMQLNIKVLGIL